MLHLYKSTLLAIVFLVTGNILHAQCTQTVRVIFTSINFAAGCDYSDSGGLDATFELYNSNNDRIYHSYYDDLAAVTGPQLNFPIDLATNPNWCPNWSNAFTLGTFPITQTSFETTAEMYEKDSNFANSECSGYSAFFDRDYSSGAHTIDFLMSEGTIDLGGCTAYNYMLEITTDGAIELPYLAEICSYDTLLIGTDSYHAENLSGLTTISGLTNTCDTIYTVTLNLLPQPDTTILGPDFLCEGSTTTLKVLGDFGSYSWDSGSIADSTLISDSGLYQVTLTTVNGCSYTSSKEVDQLDQPDFAIVGDTVICLGAEQTLTIDKSFANYEWNDGSTAGGLLITNSGNYTVTVSDDNGCTASSSITVVERDRPLVSIMGASVICNSTDNQLSVPDTFATILWSTGDDSPVIPITLPETYSVTVTDQFGCSGIDEISVSTVPQLILNIDGETTYCPGDSTTLFLVDSYDDLLWSTGDTLDQIYASSPGTYSVSITDIFGCPYETAVDVSELMRAEVAIIGDTTICVGSSNTLLLDGTFSEVSWSTGDTTSSIEVNTPGDYAVTVTTTEGCTVSDYITINSSAQLLLNIDGDSSFCEGDSTTLAITDDYSEILWSTGDTTNQITVSDPGLYTVSVTDLFGCLYESDVMVIEQPMPTLSIIGDSIFCTGTTTMLSIEDDVSDILWSTGSTTSAIEIELAGNYSVTITNNEGCVATDEITITQLDTMLIEIDSLTCDPTAVEVIETITTLDSGCELTTIIHITLDDPAICFSDQDYSVYIPNTFLPSAGGNNGTFELLGPGTGSVIRLEIYDRWGNLIHLADQGAPMSWNGTKNNQPVPPGVYLYKLAMTQPDATIAHRIGSLTLLR